MTIVKAVSVCAMLLNGGKLCFDFQPPDPTQNIKIMERPTTLTCADHATALALSIPECVAPPATPIVAAPAKP